jgi:uncharacterized membrane protein YdbT with pleckstrin-like domain
MGYLENNLMAGERIVYKARLHRVIFLWSIIWSLLTLIWLVIAILFFWKYAAFGSIFLLLAIITGIKSFIRYNTCEFGITNKRVLVKIGFIRRNSIEVLLNKVEGIQVNQDILGRILGYGSITVTGTGGTKDPFHTIVAPFEFRKKAQEQIASVQDAG